MQKRTDNNQAQVIQYGRVIEFGERLRSSVNGTRLKFEPPMTYASPASMVWVLDC
jgi:hypothetical protein